MKKGIPEFRSEAEEFEFWSKADSTEYVDWSQARPGEFPNLKRTRVRRCGMGNIRED